MSNLTTDVQIQVEDTTHVLAVTAGRTPDGEHYTGAVDGHRFKFMIANRATAERERDKAMRALAAWQAIIDEGMVG